MLGAMLVITEIIGLVTYQVVGVLYDTWGRRYVMGGAALLGAVAMGVMPFCP